MKTPLTFRALLAAGSFAIAAAALAMYVLEEQSGATVASARASSTALNADPAEVARERSTRGAGVATARTAIATLRSQARGEVIITQDASTASSSTVRVAQGGDLYPKIATRTRAAEKVTAFLAEHGNAFGIENAARQLKLVDSRTDQYGHTRVSFQQMHQGVPVFAAVLRGHVSDDGRLTAINGKFVPQLEVATRASIQRADAIHTAVSSVGQQQPAARKSVALTVKSSALMVYRTHLTRGMPGENHLVYEVQVGDGRSIREFVYIDAHNGKIVDQITGVHGVKNRRVYEATFDPDSPELPPPLWREGDRRPALDPAHEDEVTAGGQSYNLFFNLSGGTHRSWNGSDAQMVTVNNDPTILCPNANWNGTSTNYCSGTSADDVVAHEWSHAYTQETSGLIYQWQSGALNESYSDVFGETLDQINNREGVEGTAATGEDGPRSQNDAVCSTFTSELPTADNSIRWLMGEDAFAFSPLPPIGDAAIRDMWRPRCAGGNLFLGDPGHVNSARYSCSADDAGGVHTNSGVNNRAYALIVDGDTVELKDDGTPFASPVTVRGIGLTKAAHIFWRANSVYNGPASNFADNADSLVMACQDLVGRNLNKLVTSLENGTGLLGSNEDTIDPQPELSGEVITVADCAEVEKAIAAVEMRFDVAEKCNFGPLLDPSPAPMCGTAPANRYFAENFENGVPAGWGVGQMPVSKTVLDTRPWFLRSGDLPANPDGSARVGSAMFQENRRDLGNCSTDDEAGALFLESPAITVDANSSGQLVFSHYMASEVGFDGGNVMISINGGEYSVIPGSAFVHNAYSGALNGIADQNTNPKAGEEAWHGGNENEIAGDWGQSQIDLAAAGVQPGDSIRLRWEFGQDGCNGSEGWYVDDIELFSCGEAAPPAQQCDVYPATMPTPLGSPIVSLVGSSTRATVSGATAAITNLNIRDMRGSHSFMGDLTFTLTSPAGTSITLFDGASCSGEDGIDIEFDDEASQTVGCGDWLSGGAFRPHQALAAFNGQNANGDWRLVITDGFPQDEGTLNAWAVELCTQLNRQPTATDDSARVRGRQTVPIHALANDGDADGDCLRIANISQPSKGAATIVAGSCEPTNKDSISYRPGAAFKGSDAFTYQVSDGKGGHATATVAISK
jgi:Zn-dependent metalloprotease/subtilisin-like proprotein convertase family protein